MPADAAFAWPVLEGAPVSLSGRVHGVLLNHRAALEALGDAVGQPPYKAPPRSVVLYVKPRNTLVMAGGTIAVDDAVPEVEIGAALGIVIGRTACSVGPDEAMACVAGYVIVADCSVPHGSFFRPALRHRARDASCAVGSIFVPARRIADPDWLGVRVRIDGRLAHEASTGGTVRPVARLVSEISDFMTLVPGDVVMAGVAPGAPRARDGTRASVEIDGLGRLDLHVARRGGDAP